MMMVLIIIPPPLILDILSENNIPATFFVVGQQINYVPEIVKNL
ncbi:TPA: polysaccharide deacetylase family protein [Bacillus anthracis]|nr:polysaccharide deacetylase family protein [Bacillus anthracis]